MQTLQIRGIVRPQRIGALIGPKVKPADLTALLSLLSIMWAGRYAPMIRVEDPLSDNDLRRINSQALDIVCGAGLDDNSAAKAIATNIRTPIYMAIPHPVQEFFTSVINPISIDPVIQRVLREHPVIENSRVTVWEVSSASPISLLYAAAFGFHTPAALEFAVSRLKAAKQIVAAEASVADFVRACTYMASRVSWLDLGSYGLDTTAIAPASMFAPHTVVLIGDDQLQVAEYWNLRSQRSAAASGTFLPVPVQALRHRDVVAALLEWITAFKASSNFMCILCEKPHIQQARALASLLKRRTTRYEFIDVQLQGLQEPIMIATDSEQQLNVGIESDVVTFDPPQTESIHGHSGTYMVDLIKDKSSGRAPMELFLPEHPVIIDVLRAEAPPLLGLGAIPRVGVSRNSVAVRVTPSAACRFQIPSAEELIGGILTAAGFSLVADEKRARYESVIALFGGLAPTAQALLGYSGRVLQSLVRGPNSFGEINAAMTQFSARREEQIKDDWLEDAMTRMPETSRRITKERFDRYRSLQIQSEDALTDLLTKLSRLRVLLRQCRPDRCKKCLDHSWIMQVDVSEEIRCPGCGSERRVMSGLQIGYGLNPLVQTALKEGIVPVVLTGRFLRNLTFNGFLWLPGVKARFESREVDFDLIAICDGVIIVAECKRLEDAGRSSPTWKKVAGQYLATAESAKRFGADVALLSAMAESFPGVIARATRRVQGMGMGARAIAGQTLDRGWEKDVAAGHRLSLSGLLPNVRSSELKLRNKRGARHITMGGIAHHSEQG